MSIGHVDWPLLVWTLRRPNRDRSRLGNLQDAHLKTNKDEEISSISVLGCLPNTFGASGSSLYSRLVCPSSAQTVLPYLHRSRSI